MTYRLRHTMLIAMLLLGAGCALPTAPAAPLGAVKPGEIVVQWQDGADRAAIHARLGTSPIAGEARQRVAVPQGEEAAWAERFRREPGVVIAEPNYMKRTQHLPGSLKPLRQVLMTPNDPDFSNPSPLQGLPASWGLKQIKAESAWDVTAGDPSVVVAVIDTGVDMSHPDLAANLDTRNALNMVEVGRTVDDDFGHGTHVAGIIAAVGNNGLGSIGLAWKSKIMPIRVLGVDGTGTTYDTAAAIEHAVARGASVINMSLGSPDRSKIEEQAVSRAIEAGVVVVAAAGNEAGSGNYLEYPACYPGVLSVGAIDPELKRASFSNFNSQVSLVAPGVDILSTIPSRLMPGGKGRAVGFLSGTSMASPFVAAAAALVLTVHPNWTPQQVADRLKKSASDLTFTGDAPGYDVYTGFGLLNAAGAVAN